ncbi:hypothetical protein B0J18DRAFT_409874 [Chaetomium sp. MPI-SDFR-AT-0129]|nr:hypothetical protein B0J18DRAFT_409874 [Chaetomium sp. MPI-SDFR-AT-0129]
MVGTFISDDGAEIWDNGEDGDKYLHPNDGSNHSEENYGGHDDEYDEEEDEDEYDGHDDGDSVMEPSLEELQDFYARVIHDLQHDANFLPIFTEALAADEAGVVVPITTTTTTTSPRPPPGYHQFSPSSSSSSSSSTTTRPPPIYPASYIYCTLPDQSNILHALIDAVHRQLVPVRSAALLTAQLVNVEFDLVSDRAVAPKQHEQWTPRGGKTPLEYAALYADCLELVRVMCEVGLVTRVTREEKERILQGERGDGVGHDGGDSAVGLGDGVHGHGDVEAAEAARGWGLKGVRSRLLEGLSPFLGGTTGRAEGPDGGVDADVDDGVSSEEKTLEEGMEGDPELAAGPNPFLEYALIASYLIKNNEDSCLHIAIREGNNACADYLLSRIQLTNDTDSVLGLYDHNGLTALHLALDFDKCHDQSQVEFVRRLIAHYPPALAMNSGEMSYDGMAQAPPLSSPAVGSTAGGGFGTFVSSVPGLDQNHTPQNRNRGLGGGRLSRDRSQHLEASSPAAAAAAAAVAVPLSGGVRRGPKVSAAPYRYFLESKERALFTQRPEARPQARKPRGQGGGSMNSGRSGMSGSGGVGGVQRASLSMAAGRGFAFVQTSVVTKNKLPKASSKVATQMANLLKLSCMRHCGRDRAKLKELLDFKKQIHLDLNSRTRVTARFLEYMAVKGLEPYLQYVYIPNLRVVDVRNAELEKQSWWESSGRKDYAYIFNWLKKTVGVTKIIRLVVEDDPADFHSDEVIEHSLREFDIEEWKWFRWDMCIDTIREAAPNVRELYLYWSGNRAVLRSWASRVDGLPALGQLEKICILRSQSKESRVRTNQILADFESNVRRAWIENWGLRLPARLPPKISVEAFTGREDLSRGLSEKELEEKGKKDRWLKCTESFGKLLRKWLNHHLLEADGDGKQVRLAEDKEIRVAVIDDGVNIDCDDIAENVEEGETFCDNAGHWPGYYQSSYGHGHLMACLIRDLCPRVKLYIAKLNEMWVDGRPRITPESAAKAIEWARSKDVDIISMSWTIEHVDEPAKSELEGAVNRAHADGILLVSACDDQGNISDHPYPAKNNEAKVLKIGSATTLGTRHKATNENLFDYIVPGSQDVARPAASSPSHTTHQTTTPTGATVPTVAVERPLFGSSIATARCAGLAAMILQCIALVHHPDDCHKRTVRTLENMKKMLDRMVEPGDSHAYIKVWTVFEQAMNKPGMGEDLEGSIIRKVAGEFVKRLAWEQPKMMEPRVTV